MASFISNGIATKAPMRANKKLTGGAKLQWILRFGDFR